MDHNSAGYCATKRTLFMRSYTPLGQRNAVWCAPVTAEGIERPEQLALSRAVPFAEMLDLRAVMPQRMQDLVLSQSPSSALAPHEASLFRGRSGTFR
jgi:hypothetical protein